MSEAARVLLALRAVALWSAILVGATFVLQLASGPIGLEQRPFWWWVESLASGAAVLVPFAAFAGGVAVWQPTDSIRAGVRCVLWAGLTLGLLSHVLASSAAPVAQYKVAEIRGEDLEGLYPFGATTTGGLRELRRYAIENPPPELGLSRERPLQLPPNWLLFLLLQPVVLGGFAVINTGLGLFVGAVTTGLSPPARRHTRWAVGLVGGIAFFVAFSGAASWVRSDPANSAVLGAWLPLGLPLLELLLFVWILKRRQDDRGLGVLSAE